MDYYYGYSSHNEDDYVNRNTRFLKNLCSDLDIILIIGSQLTRILEERGGNKKPQLYDLKWSSALEDTSDKVIFLHRPEYYGITEDDEGRPTEYMANLIIAKNRNGKMGEVVIEFNQSLRKFIDHGSYSN